MFVSCVGSGLCDELFALSGESSCVCACVCVRACGRAFVCLFVCLFVFGDGDGDDVGWKVTERWADSHAVKTKEGYSTCLSLVFSKQSVPGVKFETVRSLDYTPFLSYACIHNLLIIG